MATFNFTYDPGTTLQQMVGFEMAGRIWSSYLTDNTTVNIHVGVSDNLGTNVIGGALPGMRASQSYADYRNALDNGPKSTDDITALNHSLAKKNHYRAAFAITEGDEEWIQIEKRTTLNMTRAVAKAAGLNIADGSTALDGYILFSNLATATTATGQSVGWNYDYTRSSNQTANTLDFLSTALHEIGHVLGFVSGVDQPGWIDMRQEEEFDDDDAWSSTHNYLETMRNRLQYINPLDLFRYSSVSTELSVIDLSYGGVNGNRFFSLDSETRLAGFATGSDTFSGGDGYQASHWKNGTAAIMNPTLALGQRRNIGALDLRAMDVIGWDIASPGINTSVNLSTLYNQSVQALATRSSQTTTWISSNLHTSPTALVQNRDGEIDLMIQNSQVYEWGTTTTSSGGSGGNGGSGGTRRMEMIAQLFKQRGLFATLDGVVVLNPADLIVESSLQPLSQNIAPLSNTIVQPDPDFSFAHLNWGNTGFSNGGSGGGGGRPGGTQGIAALSALLSQPVIGIDQPVDYTAVESVAVLQQMVAEVGQASSGALEFQAESRQWSSGAVNFTNQPTNPVESQSVDWDLQFNLSLE
jgi:hypothetical protein